jgi:hypothetical protein
MGTRSHIYIETADGFVGTYCQFDGYPEHMHEQVDKRSHTELYGIILKATTTSGLRALSDGGPDYYAPTGSVEIFTDPNCGEESMHVDYVYVKRQDGRTHWRMVRNAGMRWSTDPYAGRFAGD